MNVSKWFRRAYELILPSRRLLIIQGDTPPISLPKRGLVLAREKNEDWAIAFRCPCGCRKRIELLLIKEVDPHWNLTINSKNSPSLYPSIWLQLGCRSHFWIKDGKVKWC